MVNHCVFMGRLTHDPELVYVSTGKAKVNFSIALDVWKKDKSKKEVIYPRFVAWGDTAENIKKFFTKGKPILVYGRLCVDKWTDKVTGEERSRDFFTADKFEFVNGLGGRPEEEEEEEEQTNETNETTETTETTETVKPESAPKKRERKSKTTPPPNTDEIPF